MYTNKEKDIWDYLVDNGVIKSSEKERYNEKALGFNGLSVYKKIKGSFDMEMPVFPRYLEDDEILFQFVRNPNSEALLPVVGEWFTIRSASMNSVAIEGGYSGRSVTEFKVVCQIKVLEGYASKAEVNLQIARGGSGGGTQIFIPKKLLFAVQVVGTHLK